MRKPSDCFLLFLGVLTACGQNSRQKQADTKAARLELQILPPTTVDAYLRTHVGFTSTGGELRCSHLPLGADSARTVIYVWAYCREFSTSNPTIQSGSGLAWPLVLHLDRSSGVARIMSHDVPRMGNLNRPDQERLFPAEVRSHPVFNNSKAAVRTYYDSLQRAVGGKGSNLP